MRKRIFKVLFSVCVTGILTAYVLSGCKASPHKKTGFIKNPENLKRYEVLPVHKAWRDKSVDISKYNKILVDPVFTEKAIKQRNWLERNNIRTWLGKESKDVADFAEYTENAFKKAIEKSDKIKLAEKPGPNTLLLQLNLVKVVPGKPVLGAIRNASNLTPIGFAISPLKISAQAASDSPTSASVAIEGIIRDSQTKKVIAAFVDREKQDAALINTSDFTAYGNLRDIVDEWAELFVECVEKRPLITGEKVNKRSRVKLVK